MVSSGSYWDYLSPHQRDLLREGSYLYQEIFKDGKYNFQDYSFLVFPFAKAFEGFIKQYLLDIGVISDIQYRSDHIRIGKLLSPEFNNKYQKDDSIYSLLVQIVGKDLCDMIWMTWKYCRNQVFHYYPHNNKSLSLNEAKERIDLIVSTLTTCYKSLLVHQHENTRKLSSHREIITAQ